MRRFYGQERRLLRPVLMRKYLIPVAAVLAWCIALTALSVFDSTDADRDAKVTAVDQNALRKQ